MLSLCFNLMCHLFVPNPPEDDRQRLSASGKILQENIYKFVFNITCVSKIMSCFSPFRLLLLASLMCAIGLCGAQTIQISTDAIVKKCQEDLVSETYNGDAKYGNQYQNDGMTCQEFQAANGGGLQSLCCANSDVSLHTYLPISNSAEHPSISRLLLLIVVFCALTIR